MVDNHFKKHQPMIRKAAWAASRAWRVEYSDMEAQGYLVYVEAIERYVPGKAKFSTFLYSRLRTLNDYGRRLNRIDYSSVNYVDEPNMPQSLFEDFNSLQENYVLWHDSNEPFLSYDDFVRKLELYDSIATELSEHAREILRYLFGFREDKYSFNSVKKYFRANYEWTHSFIKQVWQELQIWWNSFLYAGAGVYVN